MLCSVEMKMKRNFDSPASDIDDETVELRRRRDAGDPPSPITLIPVRRQSHLPSISEIHHLRLSLNEKLMHANSGSTNNGTGRKTKTPFVTAPSSPAASTSPRKLVAVASPHEEIRVGAGGGGDTTNNSPLSSAQQEYNDLHMFLIREHYKSQKSFVHSNHKNEMKRVQEVREVNRLMIDHNNGQTAREVAALDSGSAFFKRNSFLRNSWNVIMRHSMRLSGGGGGGVSSASQRSSWESTGSGQGLTTTGIRVKKDKKEKAGSGSEKNDQEMPPGTPTNSKCSSDSEFFHNRFSFQSLRRKAVGKATGGSGHKRNSSTSSFFSNR